MNSALLTFVKVFLALAFCFVLLAFIPGDSRSYFLGAFETYGLDLGSKPINAWSLKYMRLSFGDDWFFELGVALIRSITLATLAMLVSMSLFFFAYILKQKLSSSWTEFLSVFLMGFAPSIIAPLASVYFYKVFFSPAQWLVYLAAAFVLSPIVVGGYLKFANAKENQREAQLISSGLFSRGFARSRFVLVHFPRLLLPDFLVLFASRYASIVAGTFVVELVFNIRGLGWFFAEAFSTRSSLMLLLVVGIQSLLFISLNQVSIRLSLLSDPRRES